MDRHIDVGNCYDATKCELTLSDRYLRELDAATIATYGYRTEYLDVSHNRITKLDWLYEFPHLKCLIMDDNRLREAHLAKLKVPLANITTLTLNKNELSDLGATAKIFEQIFPNLQYLSLHGNPMCPDNLLLQPFSEFVPYEYTHYRTFLRNALPHLKFLDHYSLDIVHPHTAMSSASPEHSKQQQWQEQPTQHHRSEQLPSTSGDLWSKLKSFLSTGNNNNNKFSSSAPSNCDRYCAPDYAGTYKGIHSEGNRYIQNSDL